MSGEFLPVTMEECRERGIEQPDFVYVCGDAYVDHSSFEAAIICRLLESRGYSVGMIAQPDWKDPESIQVFGEPRLGFLISAGNMDSMVNHYTVSKKHRQKDAYSPGGEMGHRPDRAVIVYGNLIRRTYKKTPIILGGIEASLRRMGHYDYWSDQVKRSVLLDSGADMISYGMGEHSIVEIADALASGLDVKDITFIRGTVYRCKSVEHIPEPLYLPSFEEIKEKKEQYARSFGIQHQNTDPYQAKVLIEDYGNQGYVVQNPPAYPLTEQEMDDVYHLPFMRTYHPMYEKKGGIPAIEEIRFSLTSNRGCFGGCNFCALTFHQGRIVQVRSHESLLEEAVEMTKDPDFKGYIHDVGGPTADFRQPACKKQLTKGACTNRQCLFPTPCKNLIADHSDYLALLRKLRKIPKVKKVFIRSGIRFDYVLEDTKSHFLQELADYHVSGQLRVAPEHVADKVLEKMGKPSHKVYLEFLKQYYACCKKSGKEQYALKATKQIRVWFLDKKTCMNPHLKYAQVAPGHNNDLGRCYGVIDTYSLVEMLDAVQLLEKSRSFTSKDSEQLKKWFGQLLDWILTSEQGKEEASRPNNHSTAYDAQAIAFALYTGNHKVAERILREVPKKRVFKQIEPDGKQPEELRRTLAFGYSEFNLQHLIDIATMGEKAHVPVLSVSSADGRSIYKAADFLKPYLGKGVKEWPYKQISEWNGKQQELCKDLYRLYLLDSTRTDYLKAYQQFRKSNPKDLFNLLFLKEESK